MKFSCHKICGFNYSLSSEFVMQLFLCTTLVTLYVTSFNTKIFWILYTHNMYYVCVLYDSQNMCIIFLNIVNKVVFVMGI